MTALQLFEEFTGIGINNVGTGEADDICRNLYIKTCIDCKEYQRCIDYIAGNKDDTDFVKVVTICKESVDPPKCAQIVDALLEMMTMKQALDGSV